MWPDHLATSATGIGGGTVQKPRELTPWVSPLHNWGYQLRELRKSRGLSLRELSQLVRVDHSHLGRFERAERMPDRSQATLLDHALGASGMLLRLWEQIGDERGHVANPPVHVAKSSVDLAFAVADQAASDGEGISVPCRLRDGSVVWVALNLNRRALLRTGMGLGATAAVGISSPALADSGAVPGLVRKTRAASAYGSTPVEHLRRTRRLLIDNDNLLGPRHAIGAVRDHIQVIQELRRDAKGVDRRDLMELQTQYGELLSWLYQDLGNPQAASYWLDRAMQWSTTVGDADLSTYVMARKAQLAGDTADLIDVVDLAEAAHRMARPRSRLAAVARTYEAYGHALRGDADESERAIDDVRNALDGAAADPTPWGVWLTASYVEIHRAQSLEALGKHDQAAEAFGVAIRLMPDGYHRDRGVYIARQAVALAGARAPEQAAALGMHALTVAEDTGSGRITNELIRLDKALIPWQQEPVAEFRATFDAALFHETETEA
ncbi:helix-turn-helix domain-containing protein [Streptomyces clavuligerus]|uniref:helix-turn-helix domain-containing protein n=1 Tax=Streptomyces clavuligerus TaxID=1901 RepID=UPI000D0AB98D|nr:helix-turn-helix domain-containing protein [Streptomyces clavuligerus]AXU16817.1 helix-turn-helix domain-containing protein [Streptomyces clavuligerus]MBY6300951.1 helix-turn-helix domain-containing protein [Streptomyces clavuligerus]QPJ97084.1 helix-turn-helix domain-containing protein [Streptomyces clavuligerus]WDN55860.1 helix-turn-helix domain-containing protein [Streptomyces clavuligerus]